MGGGGGGSDEKAYFACENPIVSILQPGWEMEGGYWGINSWIKGTTEKEMDSPTVQCGL